MKVQTSNWWCCRALEWFEEEQNLACGTCLCWYCYLGFTLKICSTLCLPALVPVIAFIQPLSNMKPALRICVRYPRVCKQQKCCLFTIFSYTLTFKGNFLLKPLDHCLSKSTHNHLQLPFPPVRTYCVQICNITSRTEHRFLVCLE